MSRSVTLCCRPACRHVASGPLCGSCWARWVRGLPEDSTESVCAVPGCPNVHWANGYCSAHRARLLRGYDLSAPLRPRKVRGASYRSRSDREPMQPVLRDAETLWAIVGNAESGQGRTGGVVSASRWADEDRQAEKLGTPEVWQAVADEALERAWADLLSGNYLERREASLRRRPRPQAPETPRAVQSPLMAVVQRPEAESEEESPQSNAALRVAR